jgi:hypothetical protein
VPYHNNIHAADVVNRVMAIIKAEELFMDGSYASRCFLLSAVIAAAVHDYQHQGFNNEYEVAFDTHVSRQFNEQAVLENQSIYHALSLIRDDATLNFMEKMPKAVQRSIMSRIINLVRHLQNPLFHCFPVLVTSAHTQLTPFPKLERGQPSLGTCKKCLSRRIRVSLSHWDCLPLSALPFTS